MYVDRSLEYCLSHRLTRMLPPLIVLQTVEGEGGELRNAVCPLDHKCLGAGVSRRGHQLKGT